MCLLPVPATAVTVALRFSRVDLVFFFLFKPFHAQRKSFSTQDFFKSLEGSISKAPTLISPIFSFTHT